MAGICNSACMGVLEQNKNCMSILENLYEEDENRACNFWSILM